MMSVPFGDPSPDRSRANPGKNDPRSVFPSGPRRKGVPVLACAIMVPVVLAFFLPLGFSTPNSPGSSLSPCYHVVHPVANSSGLTVECFLNATSSLTWTPNLLAVSTNASVVFSIGDIGSLPHHFALDEVPNDPVLASWTQNPSSVSASQLDSYFANHSALEMNISGPGPYVSSPIHLSAPNALYYFVCLFPGHFQSGMFGFLYEGTNLVSVKVTPTPVNVTTDGSQTFGARLECTPGACPSSGFSYAWSLSNSLGSLNSTSSQTVTFSAGSKTGSVDLHLNVTFDGNTVSASPDPVLITQAPPSGGWLSGGNLIWYLVLAVIVVAAVCVLLVLLRKRNRSKSGKKKPGSR